VHISKFLFACPLAVLLISSSCSNIVDSQNEKTSQKTREASIAFYNVENLFDTINDPLKDDDEFLPEAEKE
jgi:hypothetical protein